jgi:hypothetical protein
LPKTSSGQDGRAGRSVPGAGSTFTIELPAADT